MNDPAPAAEPLPPLLGVRDLEIEVATDRGRRPILHRVSFDLAAGETLCIAGESGSGKSMTALAIMRLLPEPMARIVGGRIALSGRDLTALDERTMRKVRGEEIAMIFQEPMTSLNPVLSIGRQLTEAIRAHRRSSRREARETALEALGAVHISDPARRLDQYPHELSGGMRQRVMIAMALALQPKVLIADEPTTALDVTVQAQILALIRDLQRDHGTAVLLITHDMGVVAEMADRVVMMHDGRIVEEGPVADIFSSPKEDYSRTLLAAVPRLGAMAGKALPSLPAKAKGPVVEASNLTVRFEMGRGYFRRPAHRVYAVEGIGFSIEAGETFALVGESGCGKSTTGRALLNLVRWQGDIRIAGTATAGLDRRAMKPVRRDIQMIFQDPYASLDPRMTVGELVAEPLVVHGLASGSELRDRVASLFRRVGLSTDQMRRHPHEFSGGQRQRICIARALTLSPKVIVADESVSALDVSVQARVLDLLRELQEEFGISYLFIAHDMAVVERISRRVAVMQMGQIVEMGTRAQVFEDPRHPYTRLLMDAVPIPDPSKRKHWRVPTDGRSTSAISAGDHVNRVTLTDIGDGHMVATAA